MSKINDLYLNIVSDRKKLINVLVVTLLLIILPLSLIILSREQIFRSRAADEPAIGFSGDNVSINNGRQIIKAVIEDNQLIWRAQVHLTAPTSPIQGQAASLFNNFNLAQSNPNIKSIDFLVRLPTFHISKVYAQSPPPQVSNIAIENLTTCPAQGVWNGPLTWQGTPYTSNGQTGFLVEISADNFTTYYSKFVVSSSINNQITTIDTEFLRNGVTPLPITPGARYKVRINNGQYNSNPPEFTVPNCTATPSPGPSRPCDFEQICKVANFTGTQYCESVLGQDNECITDDPFTVRCFYDRSAFGKLPENSNKCKVSTDTLALACQVNPQNRAGIGEIVTWTAQYNTQNASALGSVSVRWNSDLLEDPIKELSVSNPYPNPKSVIYSAPGNYQPRVSLLLGDSVRTQEISCPQVSVGESSLTASIFGPQSAKSHTDIDYSFSVNEAAGGRLKNIDVYVVKALGGFMTIDECGNGTLVDNNTRCRIYQRGNLTGTSFNASSKWRPKIVGDYLIYIDAFTLEGNNCTGRRDTIPTGFTPCGNQSSTETTVTLTAATVEFRIAESVTDLNTAIIREYNNHPKIIEYTFKSQTPGLKTIYVDFILNEKDDRGNPKTERKSVNVELTPPDVTDPIGIACNLDLSGKGLNVTVKGKYFGAKNANNALKANGSALKIIDWKDDLITANLANPQISAETGQDFNIEVVRSDGYIAQGSCRVGVSQISLGSKSVYRFPLSTDQDNVDIVLVEAQIGTTPVRKNVKITKDGKIEGLTNLLQNGKCYKLSLKAPNSVRKVVEFQAYEGTTVLNNFNLAIGDIFPSGGDGKINSLDRSEIIRQWSILGSFNSRPSVGTGSAQVSGSPSNTNRVLTGDFNKDSLINTFDLSYMMSDFLAQDVPEPVAGPVTSPSLRAQCDSANPTGSGGQNLIQNQSSPEPTVNPSPSQTTSPAP